MGRSLSINSKLRLQSNGSFTEFTVDEIKGFGGSCIAYEVSFYEDGYILHKGILKEFCPAYLEDEFERHNTDIIVPDKYIEQFRKGLCEFKKTYCIINEYISKNGSATNYHPVQLGLYEGNNTLYTLSSYDYGQSFDKFEDDNLYSLVKIMIAVAKAVEQYHKAGFVHLDIKPKNILVLDDVTDIIKLFDFDSLLKIDDIKSRTVSEIPVPEDYYVPELNDLNLRNIGVQTDIFEIGAMFYTRLFGKAPQPKDMGYDSEYNFDNAPLLSSVSPKAVFEIEKLFRNTLQISKRRRYKTTSQLISRLEFILTLVDSKKPYLLNLPVWQPSRLSIQRTDELGELDYRLQKDGYVFVKGMGGLGKSELAKMYVKEYGSQFHTLQFCKYVDSLKSLVASIPISGINDEDYKNLDELAKAKNKILHQCDANTLIIVDNFNVTYDKFLREFLPSDNNGFKVIFTTRCMPAADYYADKVLKLAPLSLENCKALFYMHCGIERTLATDDLLEEQINEIQFNTLLLILIAKTVRRTKMQISEILEKLREQELDSVNVKVFYEYDYSDDEIEVYNKINSHLNAVFNISGLTYAEQEVLLNMTLISAYGIEEDEFISASNSKLVTIEIIENLINQGWLENRDTLISMHSIVSDVVSEKGIEKLDCYYSLAEYLENSCDVEEDFHISELQKALATAKQLERRYKTEDEMSVVVINFLLGNIYMAIYRPKNAKACLKKALLIAEREQDYEDLPCLYNKLGDYESKFGTKSKAIDYYKRAVAAANETEGEFHDEMCNSILGLAQCYEENNEKDKALDEYIRLLNYKIENNLDEFIDGIIKDIIALCEELGRQDDLYYYQNLLKNYDTDNADKNNEILEKLSSDDFEQVQRDYEQFLSEIREQLGEESPYYKDIAKYRWIYYLINGDKEQAMRLIAENMSFIESTYGKDSMEMADFLSLASFQLADKSEFDSALEMAERAVEICRFNHQEESYTALQANMDKMVIYVTKGDIYLAYDIAQNLDFNKFSGNKFLSDIIKSVGLVLVNLSMYDESKALAKKALNTKKLDRLSKIIAAEILIICYEQEGNIDKAQQYLSDISNEINSLSTLKFAKDYLLIYKRMEAKIYFRKNKLKSAVESLNFAIELYEDKKALVLLQCYQDRGVYLAYLDRLEKAREDFSRCEEIIEIFGLSDKLNFMLYNNIAIIHFKRQEYEQAEEYYDKIFRIMPDIRNPKNYTEALICQNYGWVEYNLNDADKGEEYIKRAISYYEQKKLTDSVEYITAEYNLSLILTEQDKYVESLPLLLDVYDSIDKIQDKDYSDRIYICSSIIIGLFLSDKAQEAYDFSNAEDKNFADLYGKYSIERIDYLQKIAGAFKLCGYVEAFEFLEKSRKLIKKARLENSVWQASQDNYVGVVFLDIEQDAKTAQRYFENAKALLEGLLQQDTPLYSLVENNLQHTKDKLMEELIKGITKTLIDEEGDNI
ncbi:MAG: tetratricopeptide repeat protein [Ruminococcus sp.]